MVSFVVTPEEQVLIHYIAKRAVHDFRIIDILALEMDLTATHTNGNPLRLEDMLSADAFEFSHDIFGIMENLDSKTGKLQNCFSPRFSQ